MEKFVEFQKYECRNWKSLLKLNSTFKAKFKNWKMSSEILSMFEDWKTFRKNIVEKLKFPKIIKIFTKIYSNFFKISAQIFTKNTSLKAQNLFQP